MVGTAIVTDKLKVRWFLPFDKEVIETTEMGYLLDEEVDWIKVKKDLENLKESDSMEVIQCFEEKWQPIKVANYIIKTIQES